MRLHTLFCLAITVSAEALHAQGTDSIHYSVALAMEAGALAGLDIEIRFAGDADGETRLALPSAWAGSDSLWRHLGAVQVQGAASVREDGPDARVIQHPPAAPLTVRYRVASAYTAEPGFAYEKARPVILPATFYFHGEGVFAAPDGRDQAPASFGWRGIPAGWTVASDLDHLAGARPGTVEDVSESVALGGRDVVVVERDVGGAPLRVAVGGRWGFAPDALADAIAGVVAAENRFWGEPARPFLVPLAPLGGAGGGTSTHGTGRTDAFSIASTPTFELAGATRFLAHEYMHTWNGRELGGPLEQDDALAYWFTEGFTDFYAGRLLLRVGLWTPRDFVDELNRTLLRNASSSVRAAPNADIPARFWTDGEIGQLPYDRGHLLAFLLDHRIRQHTGGRADLDDVMQAQRRMARHNAAAGTRVPAARLFPQAALTSVGLDPAPLLDRHVERGEPVRLPAELFGPCASIETIMQPAFDRGFGVRMADGGVALAADVDSGGPAYAAGLREGMRIIRRDAGAPGDATVQYAIRVEDGGAERVLRYLPAGSGTITLQRVVLGPDAPSAACLARMSGL